jgi:hypothetical protein
VAVENAASEQEQEGAADRTGSRAYADMHEMVMFRRRSIDVSASIGANHRPGNGANCDPQ